MRTPPNSGSIDPAVPEDHPNHMPDSDQLDELVAGELAAAFAPAVPPPPGLFARVREEIDRERVQVWKRWDSVPAEESQPGVLTVRAEREELWEPTQRPGIRVKRLHADAAARRVTMLIRMEPGSSYPAHRHAGDEECMVLEGSLHVGTNVLRQGDYQIAKQGSDHVVQSTETGCLLLISSSMDDELHTL